MDFHGWWRQVRAREREAAPTTLSNKEKRRWWWEARPARKPELRFPISFFLIQHLKMGNPPFQIWPHLKVEIERVIEKDGKRRACCCLLSTAASPLQPSPPFLYLLLYLFRTLTVFSRALFPFSHLFHSNLLIPRSLSTPSFSPLWIQRISPDKVRCSRLLLLLRLDRFLWMCDLMILPHVSLPFCICISASMYPLLDRELSLSIEAIECF